MKKLSLLILLVFLINFGCGGLKYINLDEKSDNDWKTDKPASKKRGHFTPSFLTDLRTADCSSTFRPFRLPEAWRVRVSLQECP